MPRKGAEHRVHMLASLCRILVFRPLSRVEIDAVASEIDAVQPEDIADAVHLLVEEGADLEALKGAVSKLLNLVSVALSRIEFEPDDPFLASLVLENRAFLRKLDALRPLASRLLSGDRGAAADAERPSVRDDLDALRLSVEELKGMNVHYVKKENVLFPYFEARYPRYRCISLMWSLHDDMRSSLARLAELSSRRSTKPEIPELSRLFGRLFFDGHALAMREEKLLFPIVSSLLDAEEKSALFKESVALGFCFLTPDEIVSLESMGKASSESSDAEARAASCGETGSVPLNAGSLPAAIIDSILRDLPVDITFVDAHDHVAYFSNGERRIFPRSPAIIGRDVRNCHPAKSVDKVIAIIEAFKKGERDREDFWLELKGRFIRIEYRAIRDGTGNYLGTLEISQDLTEARSLTGEKRLSSF
jgi:Uncharacterized conserved protein